MLRTLDKVGFETPRRRLSGLEMASSLLFSSPDRVGLTEFRARVGSGFTYLAAGRVGSGRVGLYNASNIFTKSKRKTGKISRYIFMNLVSCKTKSFVNKKYFFATESCFFGLDFLQNQA